MQDDKPLHVRVAEALGQHPKWYDFRWWGCVVMDGEPLPTFLLPRYDTDWSATGPLIEEYGITVTCSYFEHGEPRGHAAGLHAHALGRYPGPIATGETPLITVCNLILALAAAGKLPK